MPSDEKTAINEPENNFNTVNTFRKTIQISRNFNFTNRTERSNLKLSERSISKLCCT